MLSKALVSQVPFLFSEPGCIEKLAEMVTVYVLRGLTGKRYVGITNDLHRRLQEHRSKRSKGSQIIGDFRVIHTETCLDYKLARNREKFLTSGQGRKWLSDLEKQSESA